MATRVSLALLIAGFIASGAEPRWIEGTYRNFALGFAVKIPRGLRGLTGDQDGPERDVRVYLPSGGNIVVFGEPNSFLWETPSEGVRSALMDDDCGSVPKE